MFAPHMCPEQVLKMVPREKLNGFQRSHDPLILGSVLHQITSSQRQAKSSQPKQFWGQNTKTQKPDMCDLVKHIS